MKKINYLFSALILFSFVLLNSNVASALTPVSISSSTHDYIAVFDGEGEATVTLKIDQNNYSDKAIDKIDFQFPTSNATLLRAVEYYTTVEKEKYCAKYDSGQNCSSYLDQDKTVEHTEIINSKVNGSTIELSLPTAIQTTKSATIFLVYKSDDFTTKKSGGLFSYDFKTLKYPYQIDSVEVAVYSDPDLYMKGQANTSTDYLPNVSQDIISVSDSVALPASFSSKYSSALESDYAISKNTINLDPNETYSVKGAYANSWIRLYYPYIIYFTIGLAVLVLVIIIGERKIEKK